jgi:hypothetical protein
MHHDIQRAEMFYRVLGALRYPLWGVDSVVWVLDFPMPRDKYHFCPSRPVESDDHTGSHMVRYFIAIGWDTV